MAVWNEIKTPSDLRGFVENGSDSHFFDRDTMRFFGDTMKNYGIRHHAGVIDRSGDHHFGVIELYRRKPVMNGLSRSAWFALDGQDSCRRIFVND